MFRMVKNMVGLFLIFYVVFSSAQSPGSNEKYFEQKLDHFNADNKDSWQQRYWHDHSHYRENGRAILFVHGAYTTSNIAYIDKNFIIPLAKNLNATRFYLEHRFYGESKPKSDTSLKSLVYLSSQQALEDIAFFIEKIPEQYDFARSIKWVVIGVSYGGTLATWARFQYPEKILSAVAINAPLLAKVDYGEYYENVVNSLNKCNPKCVERIAEANRELKKAIENEKGRKDVTEMFNLCTGLTGNSDEVSSLFAELAENFAHGVDFNGMRKITPKKCSFSELCNIMLKPNIAALNAYAEVNKIVKSELNPEQKCFDHLSKNMMEKLKRNDYEDTSKISKQWIYQTCTEFGFFQSSSKTSAIFGDHFPATFLAKRCKELFGPEFNIAYIEGKVSNTNERFKGLDINVTNTIFVYNTEDPWRNLFITNNKTGFYRTYKIETYSCLNKQNAVHLHGHKGYEIFSFEDDGFLKNMEKKLGCIVNDGSDCLAK
ncbi:putative serine protease K12H4.7 [Planococcus citri]|uniref:putative serine protease K12H4.7 n=1 Tax=Planococcus citri TaxID=170843 RepID=UPI0031F925C9